MATRNPVVRLGLVLLLGASVPAAAQDASELLVRLSRMEGQVRQLSGQVEQLQFDNRQLKEQVRKFQEDVEFRFQEARGGARPPAPQATGATQPPVAAPAPTSPRQAGPGRRSDAFDPSADPGGLGAPQPLGSTVPTPPLSGSSVAASTPTGGGVPQAEAVARSPRVLTMEEADLAEADPNGPLDIHGLGRLAEVGGGPVAAPAPDPNPAVVAPADPRADYEAAYAYLLQKQYERAETGFRQFLQAHPRDRLVADATYWLGETYLARSRPREAAEQFLKVSTDYGRSAKAPDAMLKLGVSLQALGARDQACATFAELERKYPQAAPSLRQGVEREQKRARCTA